MKLNYLSISSLILSNLYCVYGVLFLKWDVIYVVLIYFIESVIIGLFTFAKTFYVSFEDSFDSKPMTSDKKRSNIVGFAFILSVSFFILGFLLNGFILNNTNVFTMISVPGILSFTASHGISFYTNFIRNREYNNSTFIGLMFKFMFMRIPAICFFILLSSYLLSEESGSYLLALLILIKTTADLVLHILEHRFSNINRLKESES